ncbi:MAG: Phenylacetic acid catabolic protein, partial [Bacillota bacterium]|nr:Phenylacetic acid catabolic protein [Bacillota bacterium]
PGDSSTTGTSKQDITIKYHIRTKTNEQLRQDFFTKYIPRVLSLGLKLPDESMRFDDESGKWLYRQPDWSRFKEIIKNKGPKSESRLRLRKISYETNEWVREALSSRSSGM